MLVLTVDFFQLQTHSIIHDIKLISRFAIQLLSAGYRSSIQLLLSGSIGWSMPLDIGDKFEGKGPEMELGDSG